MYIPQTSALQRKMDISQTAVVWMPPRSHLPEIAEERADDGSGHFTRTAAGYGAPSGSSTGGMQTNPGRAGVIREARTGVMAAPRAPAVTGAQAARYAAKGEAWDRMRNEYWADRNNDAEAKKCRPWAKAIIYGVTDMWLCAGIGKRCKNKRECYMCQLEVWEEYWMDFEKNCHDAVPEIVHARRSNRSWFAKCDESPELFLAQFADVLIAGSAPSHGGRPQTGERSLCV